MTMSDELTDQQIEELIQQLRDLHDELEELLDKTGETAKPVKLDQQSVGRVSRMDAIQHQQMAKANRKQMQIQLQMIKVALEAMAEGDYGYCRSCDEPIAFARLQAKPETPLCVACQSKMEEQ